MIRTSLATLDEILPTRFSLDNSSSRARQATYVNLSGTAKFAEETLYGEKQKKAYLNRCQSLNASGEKFQLTLSLIYYYQDETVLQTAW
jgi:hypothetical protein